MTPYITKKLAQKLDELEHCHLDERGREVLNPKPIAIASELGRPETLNEQINRILRRQLSAQVAQQGHETYEEANDFEIDDDPELHSIYEEMPEDESIAPEAIGPAAPQTTEGVNDEPDVDDPAADLSSDPPPDS